MKYKPSLEFAHAYSYYILYCSDGSRLTFYNEEDAQAYYDGEYIIYMNYLKGQEMTKHSTNKSTAPKEI